MTPPPTATLRAASPSDAADAAGAAGAIDRELRAIAARARLLLYRQIAWSAARTADPLGWQDPWQDRDDRAAWTASDERGREIAGGLADVEAAIARGLPRFARLAETFALDAPEADALQLCLAAAVAPDLAGALVAATGRPVPTEPALATLFGRVGRRVLTPESALARWELVREADLGPAEPAGLLVDPAVHDWFAGTYAIDSMLIGCARPIAAPPALERWPLDELVAAIRARWSRDDLAPRVRVVVIAPEGAGRRSFAAAVAARLGLDALAIEADAVDDAAWPRVVRRAHRHAFLTRTAIAFAGDAAARRAWPAIGGGFPLVFACVEPGQTPAPIADAIDLTIELGASTIADREALWRRLIPTATTWGAAALADLARRHHTTPADVARAAERGVTSPAAAAEVVRERTRDRLGDLAHALECPFRWDDLVLPTAVVEVLRDYEYEARERVRVWEDPALRRMFPQGRGLLALFTGPPGTGKTMAAQVIAAELGLDLFRVSLSSVVSKYVGETAKNLQRILGRAEHMDAVLLFDEADALFGKRTEIRDAHDRYANTDTNHLLQAIEAYSGVAILASNKKANIDHAFLRRLRYVLEFPQPDAPQRAALWHRALVGLCGPDAARRNEAAAAVLASAIEMSGAQIKFAVLAALFAARRSGGAVGAEHLVRGVERELIKVGRSLTESERRRLAVAP
jgi:hypothetical protein